MLMAHFSCRCCRKGWLSQKHSSDNTADKPLQASKHEVTIWDITISKLQKSINLKTSNNYRIKRWTLGEEVLRRNIGKNMIISPILLKLSLCKLASVAEGQLKEELLTVLNLPSQIATQSCYSGLKELLDVFRRTDLIVLNKMYLPYVNDIDPTFLANSSQVYGIHVERIGYHYPKTAVTFINREISTATYNRVTDVVNSNDVNVNSSIVLLSAAYVKPTWEFHFDIEKTKSEKFRTFNNTVIKTPMMQKIHEYFYAEDSQNDFKIISVKLGSWGMSMSFVVPNNPKGVPELLNKLSRNPDFMFDAMKKMEWKITKVVLPLFKIKTSIDWNEIIEKIDLKSLLNKNTRDLNSIYKKSHNSTLNNLYVTKAKQKVFIEVEEMGIFRQVPGISFKVMDPFADPQWEVANIPEFIADRPFYFTMNMRVDNTEHEIFNGVYYGPE